MAACFGRGVAAAACGVGYHESSLSGSSRRHFVGDSQVFNTDNIETESCYHRGQDREASIIAGPPQRYVYGITFVHWWQLCSLICFRFYHDSWISFKPPLLLWFFFFFFLHYFKLCRSHSPPPILISGRTSCLFEAAANHASQGKRVRFLQYFPPYLLIYSLSHSLSSVVNTFYLFLIPFIAVFLFYFQRKLYIDK